MRITLTTIVIFTALIASRAATAKRPRGQLTANGVVPAAQIRGDQLPRRYASAVQPFVGYDALHLKVDQRPLTGSFDIRVTATRTSNMTRELIASAPIVDPRARTVTIALSAEGPRSSNNLAWWHNTTIHRGTATSSTCGVGGQVCRVTSPREQRATIGGAPQASFRDYTVILTRDGREVLKAIVD